MPWERTKIFPARPEHLLNDDFIFVHLISNKPLKAGRVSYWLTKAITTACPRVQARGHEIRKTGLSLTFKRGVILGTIVKRAFWRSTNLFVNKYLVITSSPTRSSVAGREISEKKVSAKNIVLKQLTENSVVHYIRNKIC